MIRKSMLINRRRSRKSIVGDRIQTYRSMK